MNLHDQSNSRTEQQSSVSYELIPRFQPITRVNNDNPIQNASIALNINAIKNTTTPINTQKNQKIHNQSTIRTKRIPTPSKRKSSSQFQLSQFRKTISQLTEKIAILQKQLNLERQQHQLDRKANEIYFSFFGKLKNLFNMQNISEILDKIIELKTNENQNSVNRSIGTNSRQSKNKQAKVISIAQVKSQKQIDLYNEVEQCQAKISQLRNQLLKSSENNIFSLLNMPFSANPANSVNLQEYKRFKERINELEELNQRLEKQVFQTNAYYKSDIQILKQQNQHLFSKNQDLIAKVVRYEAQIQHKNAELEKSKHIHSKNTQSTRVLISRNQNQQNKDGLQNHNITSSSSNLQYKNLVSLIETLRQQQRQSTQQFNTFKNQVLKSFSSQNDKFLEIQKNRSLIVDLSQRLNLLVESFNIPEIANVQTMKSLEKSFDPQSYINQIKSLKQKIDDNQKQIELQIQQKLRLQQRIQEVQHGKQTSMNESYSRIQKLQSKLKIKTKRITELENTIIDHLQNNSKRQISSMMQTPSPNMMMETPNTNMYNTQKTVAPEIIQKYENNIRNFKVLLNTARKDNQKLRQELHESNNQKMLKLKALQLLEDHNSALKQFSQKISNSDIARQELNINVTRVIDDFKIQIDLIKNQQIQVSLLEDQNRRRKSSYFSKGNSNF